MALNERPRLKHYAAPKPYLIHFGPRIMEYDPATRTTRLIEKRPLAPPNVFDYDDPDGMLHIRPAGDLKRTPRPK
jgi:hypothetical protein